VATERAVGRAVPSSPVTAQLGTIRRDKTSIQAPPANHSERPVTVAMTPSSQARQGGTTWLGALGGVILQH
jgi:hypothetical protein